MLSLCIEEVHERLNYCADASKWCMGILIFVLMHRIGAWGSQLLSAMIQPVS